MLVLLNTHYQEKEIAYFLRDSGAKALFFTDKIEGISHIEKFLNIKQNIIALEHLITVRCESEGLTSYQELLAEGHNIQPPIIDILPEEDLFAILYTSGTTGTPKGAMLTHKNLVYQAIMGAEQTHCTNEDVFLMPAPLFHVMGVTLALRTIASCARIVLMDVYEPEKALSLIEQERVTFHPGVPTMFIHELNHPSFQSYDLSSLRTGEMASAPCPEKIVRRIRSDMGCDIMVGYGMTETSPTLTLTNFEDSDTMRAETVGKAWPGVELKITDEKRQEVAVGQVGELACRGIGLMKGYYNMPEKTRESIDDDGWFYTGDLVTMDEQGYIRIVARKKELIVRSGCNIYPGEIEEIYYTHPKVMEIAIVGLPDSVHGQISCAVIQIRQGEEATEGEMKEFIRKKLPSTRFRIRLSSEKNFQGLRREKSKKLNFKTN